jgi:hypothetical protein
MSYAGGDISGVSISPDDIPQLKGWCDVNTSCKGFTTAGALKNMVAEQSTWARWSNRPQDGIYIKK